MAFLQLPNLWVSELADGVAALTLDVPGDNTNHINRSVLEDLEKALDRIEKAGRFRLLVIRSGKENQFASGPGLHDLAGLQSSDDFANLAEKGQQVFARLQALTLPTVAVINGACHGGGLELALACDYRIVVQNPMARLAVGSSELGLMPAWGGTQRLPRLIGLERSLLMLLADRSLSPALAKQWGLADALVQQSDSLPPEFLQRAQKRPLAFLPRRTWRQWLLERFRWGRRLLFRGAEVVLERRLPDDFPGPWEILAAVKCGLDKGMSFGLEQERIALARLSQHAAFRNLLHTQQAMAQIRILGRAEPGKGPDLAHGSAPCGARLDSRPLCKIGIIGGGPRSRQILALAASHGCHVVVREADEASLGLTLFQTMAYFTAAVQTGVMSADDFQRTMANIHGTTAWRGFGDLELVLVTLGPDSEQHRLLLRQVEQETASDTLIISASGTQSLVNLREQLDQPQRLAGLHFVTPIVQGCVVEVIGLPAVAENVASDLSAWVVQLGCIPVPVQDSPGLLVERVWLAAIFEAMELLYEGMPVDQVDEALRRFGMVRGPLEQADLMGLPRLEALAADLASLFPARFPFDPLFHGMIEKGWLGKDSKIGFYRHDRRSTRPNSQVPGLIRDLQGMDVRADSLSLSERRQRCQGRVVGRTINEAAWCLADGIAVDADTLDMAMVLSGWAPHRGGPLTFARQQGIQHTIDSLAKLTNRWGERFLPCPALQTLANHESEA